MECRLKVQAVNATNAAMLSVCKCPRGVNWGISQHVPPVLSSSSLCRLSPLAAVFVPTVCQDYAIGRGGGWDGECGGWAGFLPFPRQWSVWCTLIPGGRLGRGSWCSARAGSGLHSTPRCVPGGTEGGSVWVRMRPLLWAACSQLLPRGAGLCAPKLAGTTVVTASHHSLQPQTLLATSSSPASASAGFLQPLFPGSRAPSCWSSGFNVPPSAQLVARPVGVCSMMKLPMQASAEGLDVAFVGVPLDTGTSNRPGAR